MSEIKVNKISPRTACGTTTLGDSGDTFTIPAGVSITNNGTASGFGATGSASWNTTVKTGDFTAVAGEGYFVNTTSGAINVTLPAGTAGAVVAVKDYAKTFDTNGCILISNGSEKIGGSTNNATLSTEGIAVTLVYVDSTQGWLVTDDGLQSEANTNPYVVATGGTITTSGDCKIHTFTGPGTFTVTAAGTPTNSLVSYMVVAGGGGGGGNTHASGGGAGGFREVKSPVTPYTASPLDGYSTPGNRITVTATDFPITIGAGGSGGTDPAGAGCRGSNSVFSTITSTGGGGAPSDPGSPSQPSVAKDKANGGSGGGAKSICNPSYVGLGNTPPVTPSQGNNGGSTPPGSNAPGYGSAGGGGATAVGGSGTPSAGGAGGAGATTSINATPTAYAGGGGGSLYSPPGGCGAAGGTGGGGQGGRRNGNNAGSGTANTGGGGGGAERCTPSGTGGAGGSGIVIIRYKFQ